MPHQTKPNCIISSENLNALINKNDKTIKILDASFVLPTSDKDPLAEYKNEHIPNAQFFDIQKICDQNSPLPHMLPSENYFAECLSTLGIRNQDHVIIYGQNGMVMGPARAWWMFKAFGHDDVSVLDGGLFAWKAANLPLSAETSQYPPSNFRAYYNHKLVQNMENVAHASQNDTSHIIDARPPERFNGDIPEPRPGMRAGHIEGSINIPANSLINQDTLKLKSNDDLDNLFSNSLTPWPPQKSVIATCGSGVTACMLMLALHKLGHTDVSIYDGSWSEWGKIQ